MHESYQPAGAGIPPNARPLWSLPLAAKVHPVVLVALAIAILSLDFLTGPYVQVAILSVFPVALATWNHGRLWGSLMAAALPLVRLPFFYFVWKVPSSWALEAADTGIDLIVLLVLVQVISYIARQRREIQVLEGLLPICAFCKRDPRRERWLAPARALHRGAFRGELQPHVLPRVWANSLWGVSGLASRVRSIGADRTK